MNPSISSKAKLKQGLQLFNMGKQRGWDFLFLVKFWCILSILTFTKTKLWRLSGSSTYSFQMVCPVH